MGTRGAIGYFTRGDAWRGRYHHWDSYPTALGKTLWDLYHVQFEKDLRKMLRILTEQHSSWSTINGKDFKWRPQERPEGVRKEVVEAFNANPPECHCHGTRGEGFDKDEWVKSGEDGGGMEWAYVFRKGKELMHVMRHSPDGWLSARVVDLRGREPDWDRVECGTSLERCSHVDGYHEKQEAARKVAV